MALYSPSGNVVWQAPKVTSWNIFNGNANENGLWKLDLSAPEIARYKQGYSFVINMMGTPAHFFLDKDRYWTFPKPKKPLKVLMVGNSFSICALHETPKICAIGTISGMSINAFAEPDEMKKFITSTIR